MLLFAGDRWHGVLKNSSAFRGQARDASRELVVDEPAGRENSRIDSSIDAGANA